MSESQQVVEKKLEQLHSRIAEVKALTMRGEYEEAAEKAEEMQQLAEQTGCVMCMKTAAGVMAGVAWVNHLPSDDSDRKEAFLSSMETEMASIEAELDSL